MSALQPPSRVAFATVAAAYAATTTGEAILGPVFPTVAADLGLRNRHLGLALGLLAGSIAVGSLAGGGIAQRHGPRAGIVSALLMSAAGSSAAATSTTAGRFLASQVLVGFAAGSIFAGGISAVGRLSPGDRRGLAMSFYGAAFSVGLMLGALLAAMGAAAGWRWAYWAAAAVAAVVAGLVRAFVPHLNAPPTKNAGRRLRLPRSRSTAVASVAAVQQYGVVGFLPAFAVASWGLSPGSAALALATARALSVPAKLVVGSIADRIGALATAQRTALILAGTGLVWTVVPDGKVGVPAAVVFAAFTSAMFPIAHVLAYEDFAGDSHLLGAYRFAQLAVGAIAGFGIGMAANLITERPALVIAVASPLLLFTTHRRSTRTISRWGYVVAHIQSASGSRR